MKYKNKWIFLFLLFLIGESFLLKNIQKKKIVKNDILCESGAAPVDASCDSCRKKDGNYCPDGKKYFCCPQGTAPLNDHVKSQDECVSCPDGYEYISENGSKCGRCELIKYCWRNPNGWKYGIKSTSGLIVRNGNTYVLSINRPYGDGWVNIGKEGTVNCSEEDKCYVKDNNYYWGKYSNQIGYTLDNNILEQSKCQGYVSTFFSERTLLIVVTLIVGLTFF